MHSLVLEMQPVYQAVWKTIQQIARLCWKNPSTHTAMGAHKLQMFSSLLLPLWRLGQQMRNEGHRAEQCEGPSAPQHKQSALAAHSVSITHSVPQFPTLSSQCIPSEAAHSAKWAIFFVDEAKTQHPARWNLATVCLLVLTEFETMPFLSGDVVSLPRGSLTL